MKLILTLAVGAVRLGALLLALGAAGAAALALGGFKSDRLDILTHFAPFFLAVAVAAALLHLTTGPQKGLATFIFSALAVAASGALIVPDLLAAARSAPPPPSGQTLKLIQFNLWEHNPDPLGTARWIASQDADIVVLEEVHGAAAGIPKALKALYPYQTSCSPPYPCSTMILAKQAPTAVGGLGRGSPHQRLSATWAQYGEGAAAFTVAGAHFTWPIPAGPQQAQSRRLSDMLAGFDKASLILAGDFNSTPWSFSLRRQDARLGLERRTHALFSWPAAPFTDRRLYSPVPFLAIDQVYAGSDWKTVSVRRGPRQASDHFPVIVVLRRSP